MVGALQRMKVGQERAADLKMPLRDMYHLNFSSVLQIFIKDFFIVQSKYSVHDCIAGARYDLILRNLPLWRVLDFHWCPNSSRVDKEYGCFHLHLAVLGIEFTTALFAVVRR